MRAPTTAVTAAPALAAALALALALPGAARAATEDAPALLELAQAPPPQATPPQSAPGTYALPNITYEELIGSPDRTVAYNPYAMGLGAVAGVALLNVVMGSVAPPTAAGVTLDSALAASRFYSVGSAVAGAFIGQWIYSRTLAR